MPVQRPADETYAALDRFVRPRLRALAGGEVAAVTLLRQARYGAALADVGAVDGLRRWVKLDTGHYPEVCRRDRCEVIQVGGSGPLPEPTSDIRFVRVGSGTLRSRVLLGGLYAGGDTEPLRRAIEYHAPKQPPVLLADGAGRLAAIPTLDFSYRTYTWVSPLRSGAVHPWSVDRFASEVARTRGAVEARSDVFDLSAPLDQVVAARADGRAGARRLLLLGGQGAVLVLAFALLAASGLAAGAAASDLRLTWAGASAWQRRLAAAAEGALLALAGTLAGWLVAGAVGAWVADAAGSPAGAVLSHSAFAGKGWAVAAVAAAASTLALFVAGRLRPLRLGRFGITPLDVAAAGAVVAVALSLARGRADAESLAEDGGTGVFLLLLPGLVTFVAAVVCVRALPPLLRATERLTRRSAPPLRLAALSLARSPGRAAVASAFVVASVSAGLFAGAYRSTLRANEADQAAFRVPLDYTLEEDFAELVTPLETAPLERYRAASGGRAFPIVRAYGDASVSTGIASVTLLGVAADAVPSLRRWRDDFAPRAPSSLARLLRPPATMTLNGLRLPADALELELPARIRGTGLALDATIETPRGDFVTLELGALARNSRATLRARLPRRARGGLVTGLTLNLPTAGTRARGSVGAVGALEETHGTLTLRPLRVLTEDGVRQLGAFAAWMTTNGAEVAGTEPARLEYRVTPELVTRFRPRQPVDGRPVTVIASKAVAAAAGPDGLVPVSLGDHQLEVRVAQAATRFPTVQGEFVIADESWLAAALNADYAGSGTPSEVWLEGTERAGPRLAAAPFDRLTLQSRREIERQLRSDPLARAATAMLVAATAVAFLLALVGALVSVLADARDDRRELVDLESQGAAPRTLRRHLGLRTALAACAGVAGGLAAGAALVALVTDVVLLTAGGTRPDPPLLLRLDWPLLVGALAVYLAAAAAVVAAAARASVRGEAIA